MSARSPRRLPIGCTVVVGGRKGQRSHPGAGVVGLGAVRFGGIVTRTTHNMHALAGLIRAGSVRRNWLCTIRGRLVSMTFVPVADMGAQLMGLLLWSLLWVLVAAGVVGAAVWWWTTRTGTAVARVNGVLFGGQQSAAGEPPARRFLRIAFGLLWIVDGVLQAQPRMPAAFVNTTIEPGVLVGPGWFGALVGPLARAWTRHPVAADAATVWIQLGLGLLLLLGGRGLLARAALWGTVLWSLIVWVFGEAFGGR